MHTMMYSSSKYLAPYIEITNIGTCLEHGIICWMVTMFIPNMLEFFEN